MARGPTARVVLNRSKVEAVLLAVADGLGEVGRSIVESANPPDATPYGVGLVKRGGWLSYVGDKKVGGGGLDGKQPKKPRAVGVRGSARIIAVAGFGFPGRFQELGTIHHRAQPFLTPAMERGAREAPRILQAHVGPKLRAMP